MNKLLAVPCTLVVAAALALGLSPVALASVDSQVAAAPTSAPAAPVDAAPTVTWPSGAGTVDATTFGAWRNRPMDVWTTWNDAHTWNNMEQLWTLNNYEQTPRYPGRMSFAQPLLDDSSTYAGCNTGAYDGHFRTIASKLTARGFGNAYIRLSWEMNGDWYKWKVGTDYDGFKNCFARASRIFKAVSPAFAIEWNPAGGWNSTFADKIYPGDDVVDVVGVDTYDGWPNASTVADFTAKCNQSYGATPMGPCTFATFARAHHKLLSVPEWGIRQGTNGDNPVFIQQMFAFFARNADILAYEAYFDLQGANFELSHGANPLSAAAYKLLWGTPAVVVPPVIDPPVINPPVIDPPVIDPPVIDPPVIDPPVIDPPVIDPPVIDPPVIDPSVTTPATTLPPTTAPPTTVPPVVAPATTEAPATAPLANAIEPPAVAPTTTVPPVVVPTTTVPPVVVPTTTVPPVVVATTTVPPVVVPTTTVAPVVVPPVVVPPVVVPPVVVPTTTVPPVVVPTTTVPPVVVPPVVVPTTTVPPVVVPTTTVPPVVVPTTTVPKPTTTTTTPTPTTTTAPPVAAPTTPRPALAWSSGAAAANPATFATWRGRPLAMTSVSNAAPTWAGMAAMPSLTGVTPGTKLSVAQPLLDSTSTLKACGLGSYNDRFTAIAKALVVRGVGDATVRLAPDMNVAGSPFSATSDAKNFVKCFVQASKTMKKAAPALKIAWSPSASTGLSAVAFYPGSAYVDVIAPTLSGASVRGSSFDTACTAGTTKAPVGLCRFADYAVAARKPLAVGWTLRSDDAVFVQRMAAFLTQRAPQIANESYDATGAGAGLSSGAFPTAGAAYRKAWG